MSYYHRRLPHWIPDEVPLFVTWRLAGSLPRSSGPVWLSDSRIARMVMEAVLCGDTARGMYRLEAFVIMPNHVYVVWLPLQKLSTIMDWLKGATARRANRILDRRGRFWQDESYDHWIRSGKEFNALIAYVESNPVRAGLAETPEDWPWSSAGVGWEGSRQDRLPHKDHEDPREVTP